MSFDPLRVVDALIDGHVDFVLIGGVAANALGSPSVTRDLDICHERSSDNLERLATVCAGLDARLRDVPDGLPFRLDALTLRNGDSFTFETVHGPFDILATPSGTRGYPDLIVNATLTDFAGRSVWVCSLEDLIRMKIAAGRAKDRIELELLGALRDEVEGRPEGG